MDQLTTFKGLAVTLATAGWLVAGNATAANEHDFMNHVYDYIENLDVFELNQEEGRAYYIPEHHQLLNGQWKFCFASTGLDIIPFINNALYLFASISFLICCFAKAMYL